MKNLIFQQKPQLFSAAAVVGTMESEGRLGEYFDLSCTDDLFGAESWERAESEMVRLAVDCALKKQNRKADSLDLIVGGDLMNQCTATSFGCLGFSVPYLGLYGACSTFAEGLLLSSALLENGALQCACAVASSHFSSAERQYRYPLEYGCQRTPTSQRTVTGCGAAILQRSPTDEVVKIRVNGGRIGTMVDSGVCDANHMGAAMAPAAADTLINYLFDNHESISDYDLVLTGDLGSLGAKLFTQLCAQANLDLSGRYLDCGTQIFDEDQDCHAGASGCGCSAVYLCGYLWNTRKESRYKRVLLLGTGALLSPLTVQQKQSIPGIAHLVCLEYE